DRFRDRVMFPIADARGRIAGFGARAMSAEARAKYLNSPETGVFHKGAMLYNLAGARAAARERGTVILAEGYMDVIALAEAGFTHTVAPLGTALWSMIPDGAETGVREPILCFDGDAAGQRAATRAMDRILPLLTAGVSARFAFLTDGMDPDDLIRARGAAGFRQVLEKSVPLSAMIWRTLTDGRRFSTPESRAGLQKSIAGVVAAIADRAVQKQYESALKDLFYQAFNVRRRDANGPKGAGAMAARTALPDPRARGTNERTHVALAAILNFPEIFHDAEEPLGRLPIADPRLDAIRQRVLEILSDVPEMGHEELMQALEKQGFGDDLRAVMTAARLHGLSSRATSSPVQALEGLREAVGAAR
ncbi:MAG: toprim domain-containing protein, partial [Alphaproteobacteria bacterium]|nr:toprim domain-containing protein [Alphaproteobacteria bacterium]